MALRFVDLKRKYEEIRRLRLERSEAAADARPALTRLAAEFPGALRELDALPLAAIEARLAELERAEIDESARRPWMVAQLEYHSLARGALAAKRFLAGARRVDAPLVARFCAHAQAASAPAELLAWSDALASIAAPPQGRLSTAVFTRLGARIGTTPAAARELVFPKNACDR